MDEKIVRVGVASWVKNSAGQFLFGYRLSEHGNKTYGPAGGKLEFGETPEQCASRELMEETGIFVAPQDFKTVGFTNDIFQDKHYITIHCFVELNYMPYPTLKEPTKCSRWVWWNLKYLPENLFLPARNFLKQKTFGV